MKATIVPWAVISQTRRFRAPVAARSTGREKVSEGVGMMRLLL